PELLELCHSGSWDEVAARSKTHPFEVAARKEGGQTTALSLAVRAKAPLSTVQAVLKADESQITVVHPVRGSILHEALKHRVTDDVLEFLVDAATRSENGMSDSEKTKTTCRMLSRKDELGRVPLHYMVERVVRDYDHGMPTTTASRRTFEQVVKQCPHGIAQIDADGNTPLILLLLVPRLGDDPFGRRCEHEILAMIQLLLKHNRRAINVVRRLPRPWHFRSKSATSPQLDFLHGQGAPNPLACAILHGRCSKTVQVLIDASLAEGVNPCSELVTHHRETPLHVAATVNASTDMIKRLVKEEPRTVNVPDAKGLFPLDMIWIRYVIDSAAFGLPVNISRRRFITSTFMERYDKASKNCLSKGNPNETTAYQGTHGVQCNELLGRMHAVIPTMALLRLMRPKGDGDRMDVDPAETRIPLLHATCAINCPLALVGLALEARPEQMKIREQSTGRLPLHFAASRREYHQDFPTGVTGKPTKVQETSPTPFVLSNCPEACSVTDGSGQLALHLSIECAKERRCLERMQDISSTEDIVAVEALLKQYPSALRRRDGVTKLYPFQQAAEGTCGHVELSYLLLRRDPTLLVGQWANT
ncbi:MAG: hypothetical protein SGILL_005978, partial [Bacillariaceae sp.]